MSSSDLNVQVPGPELKAQTPGTTEHKPLGEVGVGRACPSESLICLLSGPLSLWTTREPQGPAATLKEVWSCLPKAGLLSAK